MKRAAGAVLGLAVLSGCTFRGVQSLPLPGGVNTSGGYTVTVLFADVSDLTVGEGVRANDVPVGNITAISVTPDLRAKVTCRIQRSTTLPADVGATLESTSLLGERFVALTTPSGGGAGTLADGATIDVGTSTEPDVETVLGSLSAILNGGDVGKLQDITTQVSDALAGHQTDVRGVLDQLTTLLTDLDQHSASITSALDGLDHLSTVLAAQRQELGDAITQVPAGIQVLNEEEPQLVAVLNHLSDLSDAGVRVINASRDATVADLQQLQPVLAGLAADSSEIVKAANILSYPFPQDATGAIKGDYAGLYATVNLDGATLSQLLSSSTGTGASPSASTAGSSPRAGAGPSSPLPLGLGGLLAGGMK